MNLQLGDIFGMLTFVAGLVAAYFIMKDFVIAKFDTLKDRQEQLEKDNIRLSSRLDQVEKLQDLFNNQVLQQIRELKNGGGK